MIRSKPTRDFCSNGCGISYNQVGRAACQFELKELKGSNLFFCSSPGFTSCLSAFVAIIIFVPIFCLGNPLNLRIIFSLFFCFSHNPPSCHRQIRRGELTTHHFFNYPCAINFQFPPPTLTFFGDFVFIRKPVHFR